MRRRALLPLLAALPAARPAGAVTPCMPGQRPGSMAELAFALILPNGATIAPDQWRRFRADIVDPLLRRPVAERDDPISGAAGRRILTFEGSTAFDMAAPDRLPPEAETVLGAWRARFPEAPAHGSLRPACFRR